MILMHKLIIYPIASTDQRWQLINHIFKRQFFQCHVFAMKSVQNLKSFWRSSQNYFVLALFSSL
jgi:hypothetical protein